MASLLDKMVEKTGRKPGATSEISKILFRRGVPKSDELDRIMALPRRHLDLTKVPDLSPLYVHTDFCGVKGCDLCLAGPARLLPAQSAALLEAEAVGGALLTIEVGGGKTLTSMLLFDALRATKGILFVPSDVRDQLISVDIPRYARHFHLPLERFTVVSYNQLSDPATPTILSDLDADTWIFDEVHSLRRKDSVRTRRVIDVWADREKNERPVACAGLSGTFTNGSVRDFAHLSGMFLRKRSPVPRTWKDTEDWACALDRVTARLEHMSPGALLKFCSDEEHAKVAARELDPQEAARMGFARRLHETEGVVRSYDESESGASLVLRKLSVEVPDVVRRQIVSLESTWSIAGEEISEAARIAAFARQLSQGFYYVWRWPGGIPDKEWLRARRDWHKAVRDQITYGRQPGMDSPALVTRAVKAGKLPRLEATWKAWELVKDRPEPPKEPVWVSDFLVNDAVRWARERQKLPGGGIIWYAHTAMEAQLAAAGIPVYGAGDSAALVELSAAGGPEDSGVIACSINAHRKGKNLQHRWSRNRVLCAPASAEPWEQCLGRTHRRGQQADEVEVDVDLHTDALEDAMRGAFAVAHYVHQTQMQRHKILRARKVGVYDPGEVKNIVDTDLVDE